MLSFIERRKEIVLLTESNAKVGVAELAQRFGVSTATIRRDINALSANGLVVRLRGGAMASTPRVREFSVQSKNKEYLSVKRRLGQAVAALVGDNVRSVLLDSRTTTEEVALCLVGRTNLYLTTNGLNVASALASTEGIEVRLTGGTLHRTSMSLFGRQAENSLRFMHFDKLILGADGIDTCVGVTTHFGQQASLSRVMCKVARQVILVADSSKFECCFSHVICKLTDVDVLVTDAGLSTALRDTLAGEGLEMHVVSGKN